MLRVDVASNPNSYSDWFETATAQPDMVSAVHMAWVLCVWRARCAWLHATCVLYACGEVSVHQAKASTAVALSPVAGAAS